MSVVEYHNLKYKVSEGIDWITERRRLLYICKTFLPRECENNIQDVLSLLDKLEEENHLAIDSLVVLKDLLEGMEKWNLLEIVEKFENKRKEYKSFLEQCGRVLDECSQLERLISICEGMISRDRQGHITDVCTLFAELEKQNNLGIKRLDILKTMAIEVEKPDLLEQVEEFKKKRKQEEDAEREQKSRRKSQAQVAAVLASTRYAGEKLIGIVTPHCTFRNVAGGIVAVTTWMILRRSSNLEEFVNTFTEAVLPLGNTLRAISEGSLCFSVQAKTPSALEALWKRYQDGTLQRSLQEFLITEEIKQLEDSEVMLTVEIDEQEYNNAVKDLTTTETQEMQVEEENEGLKDQASSDFALPRVREAHLEGREEVLRDIELNLPDRIAFVEEYLANLQETYSVTTETTDSGVWSQSAPSESGFNKDTDILDNIQQLQKEMKNVRKTLNTLGLSEEKTKDEGIGLTKRIWRAVTRKKKPIDTVTGSLQPRTSVPDYEDVDEIAPQQMIDGLGGSYTQNVRSSHFMTSQPLPPIPCTSEAPPPQRKETIASERTLTKIVVAVYDYLGQDPEDLPFSKGEYLEIVDDQHSWWRARNSRGNEGFIPSNYVWRPALESERWFQPKMPRKLCEDILKKEGKEGCFVVRNSSKEGYMYSLSVLHGDRVFHYGIRKGNGQLYISCNHKYCTLPELVNFHQHNSAGLHTRLRQPPSFGQGPVVIGHDILEIPRSEIVLGDELDSGEFATVRKGTYQGNKTVAVKMMKEGAISEEDFINDANVMMQLQHPHLLRLYGVCSEKPIYIITEFMSQGILLHYLRKNGTLLQSPQMTEMARQVSSAMIYMERKNFIHGDLAARNCYIGDNNIVKVAHFGLARYVIDDKYSAPKGAKFPVKWSPPEALRDNIFSSKSDIWAFGILTWEIFSAGKRPYPGVTSEETIEKITDGYRLPKPDRCPDRMYRIVERCWHTDPEQRPTFAEVYKSILEFLGQDNDQTVE